MVCTDVQRRLEIIDDVDGLVGDVLQGVDPRNRVLAIVLAASD